MDAILRSTFLEYGSSEAPTVPEVGIRCVHNHLNFLIGDVIFMNAHCQPATEGHFEI
jgi:hypothetical protein